MVLTVVFEGFEEIAVVFVVAEKVTGLLLRFVVVAGSALRRLLFFGPVVVIFLVVELARCICTLTENQTIVLSSLLTV